MQSANFWISKRLNFYYRFTLKIDNISIATSSRINKKVVIIRTVSVMKIFDFDVPQVYESAIRFCTDFTKKIDDYSFSKHIAH